MPEKPLLYSLDVYTARAGALRPTESTKDDLAYFPLRSCEHWS